MKGSWLPARIGAGIGVFVAALELAGRSIARASLIERATGASLDPVTIALVGVAAAACGAALSWTRVAHRVDALVVWILLAALPAGLAAQLSLGARLQSDGFYYFAHLRSLWFDHDQDLANDYRLLAMESKTNLFVPTVTGHAQSAWTIGPSLVWAPFFAVGDAVARYEQQSDPALKTDGTSFPYRQAVCVAGLVWGLLGLYFTYRLSALFVPKGWAAAAMIAVGGGSFLLWYLVKEPSMTHAPSMATVAGFTWAWAATRGRRTLWQWAALGLLAGLMGTIRWQNVLFALLPALEWVAAAVPLLRTRAIQPLRVLTLAGLAFTAAAVVGFLPQMLVWKAIYGQYFAVSPVGPQIRWWAPRISDILWSSRNGLFATSPILYVGAIGLVLMIRSSPGFALPALAIFAAMTFFNASIQDWWGSAAYGMRRFDGMVPILAVGVAVALERLSGLVARAPQVVACTAAALLVLWNLTFMQAALSGVFGIGESVSFERVGAAQGGTIERWFGHPFSFPANAIFALRNRRPMSSYDVLWTGRFLADPSQPYARIDVGGEDGPFLSNGWYAAEEGGGVTFRWAAERASLVVPLDHADDLRVLVRVMPFGFAGGDPQTLTLVVNSVSHTAVPLVSGWQTVEVATPASDWQSGVSDVALVFRRAIRPSDTSGSRDSRPLAAAVDWIALRGPSPAGRTGS